MLNQSTGGNTAKLNALVKYPWYILEHLEYPSFAGGKTNNEQRSKDAVLDGV